jgi:hypothetical protein
MGRDFSDFSHQPVIQRKGDLHRHMIRESPGARFKNRFVTGHGFSRAASGQRRPGLQPLRGLFLQGLQRLRRNPYWFAGVEGITQNSAPNGAKELSPARRGGLGPVGNKTESRRGPSAATQLRLRALYT